MLNFEDVEERDGAYFCCTSCFCLTSTQVFGFRGMSGHRRAWKQPAPSCRYLLSTPHSSIARISLQSYTNPSRANHRVVQSSTLTGSSLFSLLNVCSSSPASQIDIRGKLWICPFCLSRNAFPPHYKDISNTNLPAELLPKYTTIEYTLSRPVQVPPIFLFVVDTCLDEEDLKALRDAIVVSLSLLPSYALVGLITYGTMVGVPRIILIFAHTTLDSSPRDRLCRMQQILRLPRW